MEELGLMAEEILKIERDGPVAIITLNRPDALNALSRALRKEIVATFTELGEDPEIRAAVLTGAGRAFTAGVDLKEAGQTGFALGADVGRSILEKPSQPTPGRLSVRSMVSPSQAVLSLL